MPDGYYVFDPHDSDARVLADVRELLYMLVMAVEQPEYVALQRRDFENGRMILRTPGA